MERAGSVRFSSAEPYYKTKIEPADIEQRKRLLFERKNDMAQAAHVYNLTQSEATRLDNYVNGALCYMLNHRVQTGSMLPGDREIADTIFSALQKFPKFEGRTYRNLKFKTKDEYEAFLGRHTVGNETVFETFTSASKHPNGYPLFGDYVVHMVIDGSTGADIADTFGQKQQQEVVFLPNTHIKVKKVAIANDGKLLIYTEEVTGKWNGSRE